MTFSHQILQSMLCRMLAEHSHEEHQSSLHLCCHEGTHTLHSAACERTRRSILAAYQSTLQTSLFGCTNPYQETYLPTANPAKLSTVGQDEKERAPTLCYCPRWLLLSCQSKYSIPYPTDHDTCRHAPTESPECP